MRLLKTVGAALLMSSVLMSVTAEAAQVLTLNYRHQEFQGQNRLHLKQDLQRAYPRLRLENMDLIGVRLVAKSRQGQGMAKLIVGNDQTYALNVDGRPGRFMTNDISTYNLVDFQSPNRRSDGVWQIALQGNIKVAQVQVKLEEERRPDPRPRPRPWPRRSSNPAEQFIGAIGEIIIDEIGRN